MSALITVKNVKKYFPLKTGIFRRETVWVKAVDDVSFDIQDGETLGVVGESGCGKSTLGRTILRMQEATAGDIFFGGDNIAALDKEALRIKRREMQLIFQDPFSSLNPRMTVGDIIGEPLEIHLSLEREERKKRVEELLGVVGLSPYHLRRYPHEFSGGQRQRISIARAIALNPKFIVCDEAVSALDVSIQAQVINLFMELQARLSLTYLFISHDLSVVRHISDRILVMYLGKAMELAATPELFESPLHPYTRALLASVPVPDPHRKVSRRLLTGDVPSPINPPSGCVFHTRCPQAMDICRKETPATKESTPGHFVACHLY
ncbi:MAG: dipeptide ABC transporter ATP-binding protein [Spirochaetota bacterium]